MKHCVLNVSCLSRHQIVQDVIQTKLLFWIMLDPPKLIFQISLSNAAMPKKPTQKS